jgi:hypothetical protein
MAPLNSSKEGCNLAFVILIFPFDFGFDCSALSISFLICLKSDFPDQGVADGSSHQDPANSASTLFDSASSLKNTPGR